MPSEMPDVLNVSTSYASAHLAELVAHVHTGGVVRVMDLKSGTDTWMHPEAPLGVIPDLTLRRAVRERSMRMVRARQAKRAAS